MRKPMLLRAKNLSKGFGGLRAIDRLTVEVEKGQLLGIIGPNGAGKSTFFNLLSGDLAPTGGGIFFEEELISGLPSHIIAQKGISRTFQTTRVFRNAKVLDNIMVGLIPGIQHGLWDALAGRLGKSRKDERLLARCEEVLRFVDLEGKAQTTAGELDQEQQKRLAIGLAIARGPKLLLLDEPTGGINVEEINHLMSIIRKISEGGTTICLIEHKMKMVMELCEKIIVLNYGQKIAEGTPDEIRRNPVAIKAYLGDEYAA
jgi:branched-chain amino acid transport system ATP-binding protein